MFGDVKFGDHTLRLTLGALEKVAETDPAPGVIHDALLTGIYTLQEIRVVLDAGIEASGAQTTSSDLIEAEGLRACAEGAQELLRLFMLGPKRAAEQASREAETETITAST